MKRHWKFLIAMLLITGAWATILHYTNNIPFWVLFAAVATYAFGVGLLRDDSKQDGYRQAQKDAWVQRVRTQRGSFLRTGPAVTVLPDTVAPPYPVTTSTHNDWARP